MPARVLLAGIGNIFLGDDAFGVEVARRLQSERLPDGVVAADFGIRGVHLAYELAEGLYDALIIVDATPRGGEPGTLYVIEADGAADPQIADSDAHGLTPEMVLAWLARMGATPPRVFVVGCEPAFLGEAMELSEAVSAAVEPAVRLVRELAMKATGAPLGAGQEA